MNLLSVQFLRLALGLTFKGKINFIPLLVLTMYFPLDQKVGSNSFIWDLIRHELCTAFIIHIWQPCLIGVQSPNFYCNALSICIKYKILYHNKPIIFFLYNKKNTEILKWKIYDVTSSLGGGGFPQSPPPLTPSLEVIITKLTYHYPISKII